MPVYRSSKLGSGLNAVQRALQANRAQFAPGTLTNRTTGGITRKPAWRPRPRGGGGMNFSGEWSATESYKVDDVVVIRGGTESGTYICIRAVTSNPADVTLQPGQGIYWASLSRNFGLGVWR